MNPALFDCPRGAGRPGFTAREMTDRARRRFHQGMASLKFAVDRGPRCGVVFHHIPKCAGSSIGSAIFRHFPPWQYREVPASGTVEAARFFADDRDDGPTAMVDPADPLWATIYAHRLHLLFTFVFAGARAVRGHVPYREELHQRFGRSHAFVTILRDPVERFVSQYFFNKGLDNYAKLPRTFDREDLERVGPIWGSTLTLYLSGGPREGSWPIDDDRDRRIAEAKRAVETLDVVGFIDDMAGFREHLAAVTGIRIDLQRRNVRSVREDREEETWIRAAAQRFCAPDLEVYEHARRVRARRT